MNFGKRNEISAYGRFRLTILLNPSRKIGTGSSKEEAQFQLRTGISHSLLKRKSVTNATLFSFCGEDGTGVDPKHWEVKCLNGTIMVANQ